MPDFLRYDCQYARGPSIYNEGIRHRIRPKDRLAYGFVRPLSFSCHGNILVSTSRIGWAVCIWDMKTGELLKRHMLPDGTSDVTDMVHLKKLNAFICMNAGYESMLAFPANQRQYEMATSIDYDEVYESEKDSDSE